MKRKILRYFIAISCCIFLKCLSLSAQVVNINNGIQLVADGSIKLVVDNGGLKNDGIFKPDSSTVIFSGGPVTAITGTQPITFWNLSFQGTGTKVNSNDASVLSTLMVENTTVLDADGAANDKPFTLKSSDSITANVGVITGGHITGNVTVERFINSGTAPGDHGKSWQFLATPTAGQTIFQSWQEGGLVPAGYGTRITGQGTGFDAPSPFPALKYYNTAITDYTGITNTADPLQNRHGYMLFVRGDRTVIAYNATPNNTNMRSKGTLFTPLNAPPSVTVPANQFQSFGNPYASRILFSQVFAASTGINNQFHVWDPSILGTYNVGGFHSLSAVSGYTPVPGGPPGSYYPAGVVSPNIESGQAVFVQGTPSGGTVNFNENIKAAGSRLVNKGSEETENGLPPGRIFLFTTLLTNTGLIADGNLVAFETGFGNRINEHDARKIFNPGENFGIGREGVELAIEAREPVSLSDTIFYRMHNLRQQEYQLVLAPLNMPADLTGYFIDRFNNTNVPVTFTDSSFINFRVTADPASSAADRFILVFKLKPVEPIDIDLIAFRNSDQTNQVNWKVQNEARLTNYVIERSSNGNEFSTYASQLPAGNNGSNAFYPYKDEDPLRLTYYRIKALRDNGAVQYSNIAKVEADIKASGIYVFPNPVTDRIINVKFIMQQKGSYSLLLINAPGQEIYNTRVNVESAGEAISIKPGLLASGTYQLRITKADGGVESIQVVVP